MEIWIKSFIKFHFNHAEKLNRWVYFYGIGIWIPILEKLAKLALENTLAKPTDDFEGWNLLWTTRSSA